MSERHKYMGRLEEQKLEAKRLTTKIEALRDAMRDALDLMEPAEKLKLDQVAAMALEAAENQVQLKEALGKIETLKRVLG